MTKKFSLTILTVAVLAELAQIVKNLICNDAVDVLSVVIAIILSLFWILVYSSDDDDNTLAY